MFHTVYESLNDHFKMPYIWEQKTGIATRFNVNIKQKAMI